MSTHGTGTAYGRSTSAGCAGCHSSEGWVARIAAGISNPDNVQQGVTNPTPPNCRTCHDIHNTYTEADFALRTTEPVTLYASGATFDMGEGNLCATCHQPRREMEAVDGVVKVDSTHWGPHHGPQSTMLLGIGGAGVSGGPSGHYMAVTEGCPVCHMANDRHEMKAAVSACQSCHSGLTNFDYNGVQTEVEGLLQELAELLMAKGMLASASHEPYHAGIALSDLHPVVGNYPEAQAAALWNFIYISVEDSSKGVHNSKYTIDLLESSIAALQ
ncbi:MAG: cytochrome c3 family protein [Dehalococcoidales bacterium]|nr:cytochrome c3 family protein [Dehalococcoidales bacterium]